MNQQEIADALQYGSCPSSNKAKLSSTHKNKVTKVKSHSSSIFVSPTQGNDDNNGTAITPLRTIEAALQLYRQRNSNGGSIILMNGDYYLTETVKLYPQDSHLKITGNDRKSVRIIGGKEYKFLWSDYKTVMTAMEIESNVVGDVGEMGLSGYGVKIHGATPTPHECRSFCKADAACMSFTWFDKTVHNVSHMCYFRIDKQWDPKPRPGAVSGKKASILFSDLSSQKPTPFTSLFIGGRRAVRARYPNANPETTGLHTNPTGYTKAVKWLPPSNKSPAREIRIESPERNGTHFPYFQIGIGGPVDVFTPPESYWGTSSPVGGEAATYTITTGLQYSNNEDFAHRSWSNPTTGVVHAFHCKYWGGWQFAIDDRDMESETIYWSYGGFQEARGCDHGMEYYIDNILEELDSPGEWFYDEAQMKLYLMPNGSVPESGIGTFLTRLFSIEGNMDDPARNITLSGMTVAYTQPTYLRDYEVPSGGDWTVHRDAAVFVEGAEGTVVENILFDSPGGNGLMISGYVRDTVIRNNEFKFVGDNAIVVLGRVDLIDGTGGTQPRRTLIEGNIMREFGIWGKQTAALAQALSAQTTFAKNIFFNGPRAGININDGFGGGNLIVKNLGFNMVRETQDHGVFNSWDRQPFLTKLGDAANPSLIPAISNLTLNFFINHYHSRWPIDHDDGSCYYLDTLNFLVFGGYKNFLGHSKIFKSNIYVYPDYSDEQTYSTTEPYCANSFGADDTGPLPSGWGEVWVNNTCIIGNPNIYDFSACDVSKDFATLVPLTANNTFFAKSKYVYIQCGGKHLTLGQYQELGYDLGSTVQDTLPAADIINMGKSLLGI